MTRFVKPAIVGPVVLGLALVALASAPCGILPSVPGPNKDLAPADRLVVLWTSGDRDVAMNMVFMYALNAKRSGWWQDITFIVWGPSAKLLCGDAELQAELGEMKKAGIVLEACIACAERYGVTGKLREMGIDVKGMGMPLTEYIKEGRRILTF